jgi:hypothetical protein
MERISRILGKEVLPTKYTDHRIKTTCTKKLGVFSRVSWAKAIRWMVCSHEAKAVQVNRRYQKGADLDIIPQCRAYCVNDSITRLISLGDSVPFISLRFAVSSAEQISFVMKQPRGYFLILRGFITNARVGIWIFYCLCRTICMR